MKNRLTPAVGYIRMSTDQQQDSPARQRRDITALAERQGYRIIDWYEDHGLTGTESTNRPKFQRLLQDAKRGTFEVVLLSEQSRMSREDVFDAMLHWRLLRDAGVKIVTCQRGELDFSNLGGVITAIVDQYGAHEESVKLAQRVVSGQRLRASQGKRIGGMVFGYDREVLDEKGNVVRRVHFREHFCKPRTWTTRLVPSADREAVKAVRWAFDAIRHGHTIGYITREFNARGLKTVHGNEFGLTSVQGILENPVYAGIMRAGYYKKGKFCTVGEEGVIVVENAHEAIVAPAIFDEVARILAGRHRTYAPCSRYLLSGLITCIHCGRNMSGVFRQVGSSSPRKERYYFCSPSKVNPKVDRKCPHPSVRIEKLEQFVLNAIRTHLLDRDADQRIKDAIVRARSQNTKRTIQDEKRLQEVRRKIERGTENLALADKRDFAGISKLLTKWREEEAEIAGRIEQRRDELAPLPEALKIISQLAFVKNRLQDADHVKLQYAIRQTVSSIRIGTRMAKVGNVTCREHFGELRFHDALLPGKAIEIPDEAIGQRKIWREIGELARRSKTPLHLVDFAKYIGTKDLSRASHHVRKAVQAGLMRKVGWFKGWVATG
jgi:site-specific DNA recombinase